MSRPRTLHIVDLQSLDEDRLGEQLSVVWELEVGQTVTPPQGLPEHIYASAFDDPSTLAVHRCHALGSRHLRADSNRYQAPSGPESTSRHISLNRPPCPSPRPCASTFSWLTTLPGQDTIGAACHSCILLRHRARNCNHRLSSEPVAEAGKTMREKFGLSSLSSIARSWSRSVALMGCTPTCSRCTHGHRQYGLAPANPRLTPPCGTSTPSPRNLKSGKRFAFDVLDRRRGPPRRTLVRVAIAGGRIRHRHPPHHCCAPARRSL